MRHYDTVQALRAVAALAVVYGHAVSCYATYAGMSLPITGLAGSAGVDLFFVISGFIMAFTTHLYTNGQADAASFVRRRVIRVVPLYWLYTTLFLALYWVTPSSFRTFTTDLPHILGSYLFVPYPRPDGLVDAPVVFVGWTLNLEMVFYLVFAAGLCFRSKAFVVTLLACLGGLGIAFEPQEWWKQWLAHPLYLEFLYGMGVAWAVSRGFATSRRNAWLLIALGFGGFALVYNIGPAVRLAWGPCAMLIVLGAVALEQAVPKFFRLLGDASYSIYLTHIFTLPVVLRILAPAIDNAYAAIVAGIACAGLLGVLAYVVVEKPMLRHLHRIFPGARRSTPQPGAPSVLQSP
jgi:exopolysaccharide production protein ExoZ